MQELFKKLTEAMALREDRSILVKTHDGKFHADEAMAIAVVQSWAKTQQGVVSYIRTRDTEVPADLVFDVDGVNDTTNGRFDHHNRSFDETHPDSEFPMASAGQAWKVFGREILKEKYNLPYGSIEMEYVWGKVDQGTMTPIDALDNGYCTPMVEGVNFTHITLNGLVSTMNDRELDHIKQDRMFGRLVVTLSEYLDTLIESLVLVAEEIPHVLHEVTVSDGPVVQFSRFYSWTAAMEMDPAAFQNKLLFTYPEKVPGMTRIQTFPKSLEDFMSQRCSAPASLRGYRWDDNDPKFLDEAPIEFIHKGGFIGGIKTADPVLVREACLEWIRLATVEGDTAN